MRLPERIIGTFQAWKISLSRRWWLWPLIILIRELLKDRFVTTINRWVDSLFGKEASDFLVSIANYLPGSDFWGTLTIILTALLGLFVHAYITTRPSKTLVSRAAIKLEDGRWRLGDCENIKKIDPRPDGELFIEWTRHYDSTDYYMTSHGIGCQPETTEIGYGHIRLSCVVEDQPTRPVAIHVQAMGRPKKS